MTTEGNKIKILFFGKVEEHELETFVKKLNSLNKSKAGPFDVCFCVGPFFVPSSSSSSSKYSLLKEQLPIPVYLQNAIVSITTPSEAAKSEDDNKDENNKNKIVQMIGPNLYSFPTSVGNIYQLDEEHHASQELNIDKKLKHLIVATCPPMFRVDDDKVSKPLLDKISHVSYIGCDLLLTDDWPQGIEPLLQNYNSIHNNINSQQTSLSSSYDISEVALRARARYHVSPSASSSSDEGVYDQSGAFEHLSSITNTNQQILHTGRFITIAAVIQKPKRKDKKLTKFVHALGITPLHQCSTMELQQQRPAQILPCPFTDANYQKDDHNDNSSNNAAATNNIESTNNNIGLSEAQARRIMSEQQQPPPPPPQQQQYQVETQHGFNRWGIQANEKNRKRTQQNDNDNNYDPTSTTLFIHGLHKDVSGQLQSASSIVLLQAFTKHGALKVRHPPNVATTSYAFIEFPSHDAAKQCLQTVGREIIINGVNLDLKWATHNKNKDNNRNDNNNNNNKRQKTTNRLTEQEAKDSQYIYFRFLYKDHTNAIIQRIVYDNLRELIRKWMEHTLEEALAPDDDENNNKDDRVTAETEPALQVKLGFVDGKYGFFQFASHAAAQMTLATLTKSSDGGLVQTEHLQKQITKEQQKLEQEGGSGTEPQEEQQQQLQKEQMKQVLDILSGGLALHWAHPPASSSSGNTDKKDPTSKNKFDTVMIQDDQNKFQFQRQFFPKDSRQDCWFCLASKDCEKHLIAGIYEHNYIALPKGPIHPGHVLIIPVTHSNTPGIFMYDDNEDKSTTNSVIEEMNQIKEQIKKYTHDTYKMDLFVFERAIQTKGGLHSHMQCVPIPTTSSSSLELTLLAQAKTNHMDLREIQNDDLSISSIVNGNNDITGYFYAEIHRSSSAGCKRFLYTNNTASGSTAAMVPMQLGREVIAAIMGQPNLAHWKSCVVDQEKETSMASEFREAFAKYL